MEQTKFDLDNIERLISMLNGGNNVYIWRVQGNNTKVQSDWDYCLGNQVLAFNAPLLDMSGKSENQLINEYKELDGKNAVNSNASLIARQSYKFRDEFDEASIVISCKREGDELNLLGWGECIDSAYHYDGNVKYKHYKNVTWHQLPMIKVSDTTNYKKSFDILTPCKCAEILKNIVRLNINY